MIDSRKSDFDPKAKGKWLGTIIDTIEMTFTVPSERINGLLADIKNSSAHKELLAIKCVLDCFGGVLQSQSVQVRVDNSSACRILSVGSAKSYQQNTAIDVFNFCLKFNIKLISQWIPRDRNELADYYSRIKDTGNWSIDNDRFRFINNLYGPFTVDRFANNLH